MLPIDRVVEIALRYDEEERPGLVAELCAGDAAVAGRVLRILETYDDDVGAWPPQAPCRLGPFHLEQQIGAGAHGIVYVARRVDLDGYVAVKLFRPSERIALFIEHVRREANVARRIGGDNVLMVFDAGRIPRGPYYIEMELAADPDPATLGQIRIGRTIEQVPWTAAEAADAVERLCRAVEAAHALGVVHGDIKPQNVLFTPVMHRVKLGDFGVATSLAAALDGERHAVGTVEYMAPEQFEEREPPSVASDVYTLGGTLYHMLGGRPPHPSCPGGRASIVAPLPRTVPVRLRDVIMKALSPRPEDRYATAGELGRDLRNFLQLKPTIPDRRRPHRVLGLVVARHTGVAAVAALMVVVGVGEYGLVRRSEGRRGKMEHAAVLAEARASEWSRQATSLERRADAAERSARDWEDRAGSFEKRAGAAERVLQKVTAQLERLGRDVPQLQGILQKNHDILADVQRNNAEIRKENDDHVAEASTCSATLASKRSEAEQCGKDLDAAGKKIATLEGDVRVANARDADAKKLTDRLEALARENGDLVGQLRAEGLRVNALQSRLDALEHPNPAPPEGKGTPGPPAVVEAGK